MDAATRAYIRQIRSEHRRAQIQDDEMRKGDGWCYYCTREIVPNGPIDPFKKFCSRICAVKHAEETRRGYQSTFRR